MSFNAPNTVPPGEVKIRVFDRYDGQQRTVLVDCDHSTVHLACSKPDVVSTPEQVREALSVHCRQGCRCSASCWSDWHYMEWPYMRHQPCKPEVN